MKRKIFGIFLICFFGFCMGVNALESPEVYNRDKKVILNHGLFNYNEEYYFHLDDLEQLGLTVIWEDKKCSIIAEDCLGEDRKLVINKMFVLSQNNSVIIKPIEPYDPFNPLEPTDPFIPLDPIDPFISLDSIDQFNSFEQVYSLNENSISVNKVYCDGTYKKRSMKKIGETLDITGILEDYPYSNFSSNDRFLIKVGDEYYISSKYIGENMSYKYLLDDERMDFYISNTDSVLTQTTVNLNYGAVAPAGGCDVNIYTAYKIGEGNSLSDFEILSSARCTILENERSAKCFIETPAEKINSNNIYYIADFGGRYALLHCEYNFSEVGSVLVYGRQKDVTYTVDVALPEIDEVDVPFTVYVEASRNTYSKEGVVKAGEISTVLEVTGLPLDNRYSTRIEFGYHKYKNAYLKEVYFVDSAYARDFKSDFVAELSREVVCRISLPDGYIAEGDIEVEVTLSKFFISGISIVDDLTDWSDTKKVILNNENRYVEIYLYNQTSESMLSYKLTSNVEGLCREGYLGEYCVSSEKKKSQKIKENISVEMPLLQRKNITVTVNRPLGISTDKDIFAKVMIMTGDPVVSVIDYTNTPLIPSGEEKSQFEFEITDEKTYKLKISDITGDDRLLDYCCYVESSSFSSETNKFKPITIEDDSISLTLVKCNNISGTVMCEDNNLNFKVFASCKLYNGNIIEKFQDVENGTFILKIPQDTEFYTLGVQTGLRKNSYYISDGVSTNEEDAATKITNEDSDAKNVVIKYIIQNPSLPIDISTQQEYDYFEINNISDCLIDNYDIYVAYYDENEELLLVEKPQIRELQPGGSTTTRIMITDYRTRKVKAFALKKNELIPLGNVAEKLIDISSFPDEDW